MGRSNCSRVLVYSAVMRSASSQTPMADRAERGGGPLDDPGQDGGAAGDAPSTASPAAPVEVEAGGSGRPDGACPGASRVTPAARQVDQEQADVPSPDRAGTTAWVGAGPGGHAAASTPVERPAVAVAPMVVGASGPVPVSASAAVSTGCRRPRRAGGPACCSSVPNSAIGSAAEHDRRSTGPARRCGRPARGRGRPRGSRGRCRRRPRAGRCRAGRPRPAPTQSRGRVRLPPSTSWAFRALVGRLVAEDLGGQVRDGLLLFGEREVHECVCPPGFGS